MTSGSHSPSPLEPGAPAVPAQVHARPALWVWGLVAVVALAIGAGAWWLRGPQVSVQAVQRSDLVQTVVASGRVEAPHRISVGAQLTGTVARVPVAEGQQVNAGDVLVELEASELNALLLQAEVAATQARERQRQLVEVQAPVAAQALRQAKATLDNAAATLARNQDLYKRGFVGDATLDEARKAVELADAQWRSASRQLESLQPGGSDHALAQAAVAQADAAVQSARARAGYALLRAPAAGTLISRDVEAGDVVQPGKVLMTLSPSGKTQLVVQIDEKSMRLLAPGQPAWASADAYPLSRFAAQLVYINPGVNAQTGAVEVKLDVPQPPAYLRQDMTVSVDIEVARRARVLLVPSDAVHQADGATWVDVVADGRAQRRAVRLGQAGAGHAEVLEGLAEGEQVMVSAVALRPLARVRLSPASRPASSPAPAPAGG